MYDKYSKATPITIGSKIPSHKGILFSNNTTTNHGVTMHFYRGTGGTFSTALTVSASSSMVLPIEVHTIPTALQAGVTAFYVN
jgi:hypothetical protein